MSILSSHQTSNEEGGSYDDDLGGDAPSYDHTQPLVPSRSNQAGEMTESVETRTLNRMLPRANRVGGRHKPIYVPDEPQPTNGGPNPAPQPRSRNTHSTIVEANICIATDANDTNIKLLTEVKHRVELTLLDFLVDYERRVWIAAGEESSPRPHNHAMSLQEPHAYPAPSMDTYKESYSPRSHAIPIPETFDMPLDAPPTSYDQSIRRASSPSSDSHASSPPSPIHFESSSLQIGGTTRDPEPNQVDADALTRSPKKRKKKPKKAKGKAAPPGHAASSNPSLAPPLELAPPSSPLPVRKHPSASAGVHTCVSTGCIDPFCLRRTKRTAPPSPLIELEKLVADLPPHPNIDMDRMVDNLRRMVAIHEECDREVDHSQAALRMEGDSVQEVALRLDLVQACERRLERLRGEYMKRLQEVQQSIDVFREASRPPPAKACPVHGQRS
ncbi:hypothetical protein PUNSTDRAFT_142262 [Punctularia strigosozonata HHB-11173 SS5]|uniref:uncharacterized protein n=1 Tax=Punctularia strigosozonata (strain HHB-11173) TaxID=741275 RepID=UPI0004418733|nr:uncharacterized protein PUNSTDRAFT_142262 [Punctularia strigosozonata HHB-11173 SS5]EIN10164.1 hypothetical protein PUNSTDRAFT_142262 [Punctularia strigosozonata HHB-11173 SS5]